MMQGPVGQYGLGIRCLSLDIAESNINYKVTLLTAEIKSFNRKFRH
jgi:hypothetical protein